MQLHLLAESAQLGSCFVFCSSKASPVDHKDVKPYSSACCKPGRVASKARLIFDIAAEFLYSQPGLAGFLAS